MTEAQPTNQVRPSAWLANNPESRHSEYIWEITPATVAGTAIRDGDYLVISETGKLTTLGRIARVRLELHKFFVYFDQMISIKSETEIFNIGHTAHEPPLNRLSWDMLIENLVHFGLDALESLPTIVDPIYVRELLELSVRDDLLGPAKGPFEEIVDMSVRDRYLIGKIAPITRALSSDNNDNPSEATQADLDLNNPETQIASRHERTTEISSLSGTIDAETDALDEIDTSNNQSLVPSSIGLTFCVAAEVTSINVEAFWGSYDRVPNDEHNHTRVRRDNETGEEQEVRVRVWRRRPCGGQTNLTLIEGPINPIIIDDEYVAVRIQGVIRINQAGDKLVTLFLINGQEELEENRDRAWLFQPKIQISAALGEKETAIFKRRPINEQIVDDPELDRLALIYRNRLEFAVGHGTSVHVDVAETDLTRAECIQTEMIPKQEVETTETPGLLENDRTAMKLLYSKGWLDMANLATMDKGDLEIALNCLVDDHLTWIGEENSRIGTEIKGFDRAANDIIEKCRETNSRLREGISHILNDPDCLTAFRFANEAMATQRVRSIYAKKRRSGLDVDVQQLNVPGNRSWRAFQLAFLLLSIPSLNDPNHKDRTSLADSYADLLWFPTGGGKTEAYLGVAAFAMAIRRLKPNLGGLDASRGLGVIMRYTLRLLTLQQFQRATALLCAMEVLRSNDEDIWGPEPFTLGLWVGNRVTPGTTSVSKKAIEKLRNDDGNRSGLASPAQLTNCPWCGSSINPGRDITADEDSLRTTLFCGDRHNVCEFSRGNKSSLMSGGLPVVVVDEEIYLRPPSMLIATVDKFAMMSWRAEVGNIFGHISEECERHGLLSPGHDCGSGHRPKKNLPIAKVKPAIQVRPPDLIIQDEFHLISGPLGTMVGLYETAVDALSSWKLEGVTIRPKIVASTATVRRADEQVKNVFLRKVSIFPPSGLDVEDNFFSKQRPLEDQPGRRYIGICSPGNSRPAVLIRVYTAFLTASQWLFEKFGPVADPYMTLVGYFNSLRELGGMRRLTEDDVQTRAYRVAMSLVERPGLAQRSIGQPIELTSRVSSQEIPKYLDNLDVKFKGRFTHSVNKWIEEYDEDEDQPSDIVLATNMLSVGVDVDRLGLMVINGQPKGVAEYIQASSRVGRSKEGPGLVASVLTWSRPRDLSHYETFEHFHNTFYQFVEAQSVTPFSPRALDRGLTGTMLALARQLNDELRPNSGAGRVSSPSIHALTSAVDEIAERSHEITEHRLRKLDTQKAAIKRSDLWTKEAAIGGRTLVYNKRTQGGTEYQLLQEPGVSAWSTWTVPMSMREVEPGVGLIMSDDRNNYDPPWRPQRRNTNGEVE